MAATNVSPTPDVKLTATLEAPRRGGAPRLLTLVLSATTRTAPGEVIVEMPEDLMPDVYSDVDIVQSEGGPNLRDGLLMDTWNHKWDCTYSVPGLKPRIQLKFQGVGAPAVDAAEAPSWELRFMTHVYEPQGDLANGITLTSKADGRPVSDAVVTNAATPPPASADVVATGATPAKKAAPPATAATQATPATPVVELWVAGPDVSALRFGESFTLSWRVSQVLSAELCGPLSANERLKSLVSAQGSTPVAGDGTIDLVATGPMYFSLRAQVPGQSLRVVRTLTVGMLRDPRGGRVDVWPQQVLPRGPVACHWSTFKVTRFKFHGITGDVVDGFVDAPSITDYGHEHDPEATGEGTRKEERTLEEESFTVDYGPRAGREWTVSAESEPRGDVRAIQSRVSAIGVRKLQSSLKGAEVLHGLWPYLAVSLEKRGRSEVSLPLDGKQGGSCEDQGGSHAISMAAGSFYLSKAPDDGEAAKQRKQVRREWIAVAKHDKLELHVNKLKGERSYKVDPEQHKHTVTWLASALAGATLGVGAAEHVITKDGTSDVRRGEVVVVVRRLESKKLTVREIHLPLHKDDKGRQVEIEIVDDPNRRGDASVRLAQDTKVRVVALWPRVYLFGNAGVVYSYPRLAAATVKVDAVTEPDLYNFASPDWEVVAVAGRPTREEQDGKKLRRHPRGGYLFALHRKDGDLRRIAIDEDGKVKVTEIRKMATANDKVAKLHDLQLAQANAKHEFRLADGRILVRKGVDGRRFVVHPINHESTLLRIGGALVARSEVHDPSVRPVALTTESGTVARGLQDRAYNPRLDLWVRCGHPFHEARGNEELGKGALLATTAETLYCRTPGSGEISYISPIEPSHLGLLGLDLTPDPNLGAVDQKGPVRDTLYAGNYLERGGYLQSANGAYRLTYTKQGNLVLHPTALAEDKLDERWTAKDPAKCLFRLETKGGRSGRASLELGGDLVLTDDGGRIASVREHPITAGTLLRTHDEEERVKRFQKLLQLTVTDDGKLLCSAKLDSTDLDIVVWGAPSRARGSTLRADDAFAGWLAPWEYLESEDKAYCFGYHEGKPRIMKMGVAEPHWAPDLPGAVERVLVKDGKHLVFEGPSGDVWSSRFWGGERDSGDARAQLVLGNDGTLTLGVGTEVFWKSGQCFGDRLDQGKQMSAGQYLESPGKKFRLVLQRNGNLVLYNGPSHEVWSVAPQFKADHAVAIMLLNDGQVGAVKSDKLYGFAMATNGRGLHGPQFFGGSSLRVDDAGLALRSRTGAELYSVRADAWDEYPTAGKIRFDSALAPFGPCYIRNWAYDGHKGNHLFACGQKYHSKNDKGSLGETRQVYAWVEGAGCSDDKWMLLPLGDDRYLISNVKHSAYLYASDVSWKDDRKGPDDKRKDQEPYTTYTCAFTSYNYTAGDSRWVWKRYYGADGTWRIVNEGVQKYLCLTDSKCDDGKRREVALVGGNTVDGMWWYLDDAPKS